MPDAPNSGSNRKSQVAGLGNQVIELLRTPMAAEADGGVSHPNDAKAGNHSLRLGGQVLALGGHIEPKLPTPTVSDQYTDSLNSTQHSDGSLHSVTLAQIVNRPDLLPTPLTTESHHGDFASSWNRNSPPLATLLHSETWGRFTPAIERWENITGRPAPQPTVPDGKNGQHRLSAAFTEWLMGLPGGWITDAGLTRNEQLKACGNGVVPQQAELALRRLLNV